MMTKESEKSLKVSRNVEDKTNRADEIQLRSTNSGSESRRESNNRNNKKSPLPHKAGLPPSSDPPGLNSMGPALTVSETHSSQNGHPEPPAPTSGGAIRALNKCCLCWCCCCSCSCSAPKGAQGNRTKAKDTDSDLNCDDDVPPSLEEIRSWGDSFDKLMRHVGGRKVFRDFLKCEYSEENILFWLACEDLKKESKPELVEEKARLIYEDYISILSPKEVSLDSRVREVVNQNMVDPSPHSFDEAQLQIYTLMHRDSYPRFVNSLMYKKLAQLNVQHRGSSVSQTGVSSNPASRKESLAA